MQIATTYQNSGPALQSETSLQTEARLEPGTSQRTKRFTRVLLVEDDPDLREALKARLLARGCLVSLAGDGASAKWNLTTRRFDAVLLDLGLPNRGGLDVMADVAEKGDLPPVVVLTGADRSDQELARTLGAAFVLQKPSPFRLIADALESSIEG